ncbi:MAG: leucyl aminopeptidase family protein [Actinobacteria bacterium]|nr:leucyl aminopeptidase family protein [Actinomycetota bacterium]
MTTMEWIDTAPADAATCVLVAGDDPTPTVPGAAPELLAHLREQLREDGPVAHALTSDDGAPRALFVVAAGGDATALRTAGRTLGEQLVGSALAVALPSAELDVQPFFEGLAIARHRPLADGEQVLAVATAPAAAGVVGRAGAVAQAANRARDLIALPPSELTPDDLVAAARRQAQELGIACDVLDGDALAAGGYGGLLGVSAGSVFGPALVELRYRPVPDAAPVALVGKGVTFDAGGLQVKTTAMELMKADMSGAAVALGALAAVCALGVPINIDVVLVIAENMPGPNAYRAGDRITQLDGTTTEVTNTDAEGRLMLADGIVHARRGGARAIVDVATLTDPFALGDELCAICSADDALADQLVAAGRAAGEPAWPLPVWRGYRSWLDSAVATRRNYAAERGFGGMPFAGTITAAVFLSDFAGDVPWAHFDIASTAMHTQGTGPWPAGPAAPGVATLVRWLEGLA